MKSSQQTPFYISVAILQDSHISQISACHRLLIWYSAEDGKLSIGLSGDQGSSNPNCTLMNTSMFFSHNWYLFFRIPHKQFRTYFPGSWYNLTNSRSIVAGNESWGSISLQLLLIATCKSKYMGSRGMSLSSTLLFDCLLACKASCDTSYNRLPCQYHLRYLPGNQSKPSMLIVLKSFGVSLVTADMLSY